jgi:hypothetical protein
MRKWQNKLNNESKTNKTTTDLLNNITGNTVEMIITNVLTQHTVVTVTKINVHETIADDHPREIAPTPTCAVQAITTETAHHSTMTKRNISTSTPDFTQHHRNLTTPRDITRMQHHSRKEQKTPKHIKRKDKLNKTKKTKQKKQPLQGYTMKLGSGILKLTLQQLSDKNFHFYNS